MLSLEIFIPRLSIKGGFLFFFLTSEVLSDVCRTGKKKMHKFRAQDESVMLHIRGHKSRQLVHVEVHKLNLNTVIDLEYLV